MTGPPVSWPPGTPVVVREMFAGKVWAARPMRVVHTGAVLGLWMSHGTPWQAPDATGRCAELADRSARRLCAMAAGTWTFLDRTWKLNTLWLVPQGAPFAVWVCWDEEWNHLGWYVNFQQPMSRTSTGLTTFDWFLDLKVAPDGTVTVRDETEFDAACAAGLLDAADAARVRSLVPALGADARAGRGPFERRWAGWRPPESWVTPPLPADWSAPADGTGTRRQEQFS